MRKIRISTIFHLWKENCMSPMFKTGAWVNQSLTYFPEVKYWPNDGLSTVSQSSFIRVAM